MSNEPTEKVEEVETGYRLTVTSTRGTGTRDQDKVKGVGKFETLYELNERRKDVTATVKASLEDMRKFDPEGDDNE